MPYPLPDGGPPYSTALRWFLVAVPDERAFVQAALGAYTELGYFYKWGLEKREDGQHEAADAWKAAIAATLEALEMGFPDTLLGYIDNVETLLQSLIDKPCCADPPTNTVTQPTENMLPTTIEDGVGTVPSSYGADTTIVDWAEWAEHKCGMSKEIATLPAALLADLIGALEYENQPGQVEWIGELLGQMPGVGPIAKVLWEVFAGLLAWGLTNFAGAEDAIALIQAAEPDIACAMYQADGEAAAAEAMKDATIAALGETGYATLRIGLTYFPWELWAHTLYTGQYEDRDGNLVNVPHTPADDCCAAPLDYVQWTFASDDEGWQLYTEAAPPVLVGEPTYANPGFDGTGTLTYQNTSNRQVISPAVDILAGDYPVAVYLRHNIEATHTLRYRVYSEDLSTVHDQEDITVPGQGNNTYTRTMTFPGGYVRIGVSNTYFTPSTVTVGTP